MKLPLKPARLCFEVRDLKPLLPDLRHAAEQAQAEALAASEAAARIMFTLAASASLGPVNAFLANQLDACVTMAARANRRAAHLAGVIRAVEAVPCS